jgi:HAD superfamily hydrolase (TIGR01509 family)
VTDASGPSPAPARALLLDVEGVVAHHDTGLLDTGLAALGLPGGWAGLGPLRREPALYALWEAHSVGRLGFEGYWSAVLARAGVAAGPDEVEQLGDLLRRAAWTRIDEAVLDLARRVRDGGRAVGLLSNSAAAYEDAIAGFADRFDIAHFSHRTGRRKPDTAAYRAAAAALAAAPRTVLFVDDKPRNVAAARETGMRAVLFEGATALETALAHHGLLAPAPTPS